ncbi:molybdenum cofactor biosynthesis protein MoaE [Aquabacterium fontiphilum]|uniref:molybdenum cofactor biosynthesis protein MoaE n=1 Tax=Aquabacterium fontiphilum TaxID=450365 RepID=UPI001376C7AB|nr:molybdenum cofactor biosynthesis protein MoaE [Aquabacterium fontiphilum]NBD21358.1 molybdenum cofactor biosynthesis protein MoaE [Aquabacterium fontiphilum]
MTEVGRWEDELPHVRVGPADFDLTQEVASLRNGDAGVGAVVAFVGTVREWQAARGVDAAELGFELEHYPGMTERSLASMVAQARGRFDVRGVRIIHRVGPLAVGDQIVLVAVTSAHRHAAFDCAEFLMDWLKTEAPFWKKESVRGEGQWVAARDTDHAAAARWGGTGSPQKGPA